MKIVEGSQLQKAINNCKVGESHYIPHTGSTQDCFVKDFVIFASGVYYAKYAFVALSATKTTKLPSCLTGIGTAKLNCRQIYFLLDITA